MRFDELAYVDPFIYKGSTYPTINHAYYGSGIRDKSALSLFLNSPLEPSKTFSMIKDELKKSEFDNLLNIMRARFFRDEKTMKKLLNSEPKDKWVKMLKNELLDYEFIQQELFFG